MEKQKTHWVHRHESLEAQRVLLIGQLADFRQLYGHYPDLEEYSILSVGSSEWPSLNNVRRILGKDFRQYFVIRKAWERHNIAQGKARPAVTATISTPIPVRKIRSSVPDKITVEEFAFGLYRACLKFGSEMLHVYNYRAMCKRNPGEFPSYSNLGGTWRQVTDLAVGYLIEDANSVLNSKIE